MKIINYNPTTPHLSFGPEWTRINSRIFDTSTPFAQLLFNIFSLLLASLTLRITNQFMLASVRFVVLDPQEFVNPTVKFTAFLAYWVILYYPCVLVHEFIHAVVTKSKSVYLVITTHRLWSVLKMLWRMHPIAYVYNIEPIIKGRWVLTCIAPFVVLTIVPLVLMICTGIWIVPVVTLSTLNAIFSTRDLIQAAYIGVKVPNNTTIHLDYWRFNKQDKSSSSKRI